jgi:hypothetical protein
MGYFSSRRSPTGESYSPSQSRLGFRSGGFVTPNI